MEDLIKKFVYTGVGIVALTAEKLQESVDEMVGKGKVSREEGKKMVEDFKSKVDERKEEVESKLKDFAASLSESLNLPKITTEEDLKDILKRIEALEAKVGMGNAEDVKKVVKKTASKAKKPTTKAKKSEK